MTDAPDAEHDEAREHLLMVCHRYRTVHSFLNDDGSVSSERLTPILDSLLQDLKRDVSGAGERYTHAADAAGVAEPDRIDWRQVLDAAHQQA